MKKFFNKKYKPVALTMGLLALSASAYADDQTLHANISVSSTNQCILTLTAPAMDTVSASWVAPTSLVASDMGTMTRTAPSDPSGIPIKLSYSPTCDMSSISVSSSSPHVIPNGTGAYDEQNGARFIWVPQIANIKLYLDTNFSSAATGIGTLTHGSNTNTVSTTVVSSKTADLKGGFSTNNGLPSASTGHRFVDNYMTGAEMGDARGPNLFWAGSSNANVITSSVPTDKIHSAIVYIGGFLMDQPFNSSGVQASDLPSDGSSYDIPVTVSFSVP